MVLGLLLLLTGCREQLEEIPLIIYDREDLYMLDFEEIMLEKEPQDATYLIYDSKNSQIIQNEIITEALEQDYKLLIVNPVDRLGVYPIIEKAEQENVPIIFFNREPLKDDLELWEDVYYVGAKAEQSAEIQAEIVEALFGGNPNDLNEFDLNGDNKIQAIILKGQPGHQDAEIRTEKVVEYIEELGFELDVLSITEGYFSKDIARDEMLDLITEFGETIELVISNNDAMALGAIEALDSEGFFEDADLDGMINRETETFIPIIGIDGIPDAVEAIRNGYLYGTVINDSSEMVDAINCLTDIIINNKDLSELEFEMEDDKYIWIEYKKYTDEETS